MYKFLNPNLICLITESMMTPESSSSSVNVYILNAVSGQVVHQTRIADALGPVKFLSAENWALVHYWNQAMDRFELYVVDLFEAKGDEGGEGNSYLL
jgi:hypothetical protein